MPVRLFCEEKLFQRYGRDAQAGNQLEMAGVGGPYAPADGYCRRGHDPIVCSDIGAGCGEAGPHPGVGSSGEQVEWEGRERGKYGLYESLASSSMLIAGSVYTVQELGCCDRCDCHLAIWAQMLLKTHAHGLHRMFGRSSACCALERDEDRGV
jgi:hypothetical protein